MTERAANRAPPPAVPMPAGPPITPTLVMQLLRKHAMLVLACWLSVVAAVSFYTLGQKRVFRSDSLLRLDPDPPRPLGQRVEVVSASPATYWNRREFYESEYRVMRSMRVLTAVVRALALNADAGFLQLSPKQYPSFRPATVEDAARLLASRLSVEPVKDSSLAIIRYEDTDPLRCELVLKTVVRVYLQQNLENNASTSTSALEWLNGQLGHLRNDLESSEKALNEFRQKNNVLSISLEDRHNMITAQLEMVAKESTSLDIKRYELAARATELAKVKLATPDEAGASALLHSTVLSTLRTGYAEQKRNVEDLTATLDDQHPKVLAARAKLQAIANSIAKEVENIRQATARDVSAIDNQIAALKRKEDALQQQAHDLQTFEIPYNQLNRTKTNNEKLYSLVLERARETDLTRLLNFNNVRVIDEATVPQTPIRPNVPINIGLAVVAGLMLGMAAALARELTDRSLKTPHDVETQLGLTCLGLLPAIEEKRLKKRFGRDAEKVSLQDRDLIVAAHPEGGVAEAARAIRTNLTFMSPDRPYRRIVVTSAVPEEGKTTVACSLATVLAQSGLRVLLVDTDLRRPRLHRTFKLPNDVGITMTTSGQATLDESIRETGIPNLWVITSGPIPPNPSEILNSDKFASLVKEMQERFDRIVFDSPPILPVTDAAILSQLVDGLIVVARGFATPRTAVQQATRMLRDVNSHVVGVVLNAIDVGRHDYRDYHYYYQRDGYYRSEDTSD